MSRTSQIALAVVALAALAWLFCPWPLYSRANVDPTLLSLAEPYRSVSTGYYLDGGSVGIRITDRDGRTVEYALPVSQKGPRMYELVFVGAMHIKEKGKFPVEIQNYADTKKMLIRTIANYSRGDRDSWLALVALRGLPQDYARVLIFGRLQ